MIFFLTSTQGYLGGTDESTCSEGDQSSNPGLGRSPAGEHATHSSILAWRILMDRGAWWATVHGVAESHMTEQLNTAQHNLS